MPIVLLKSALAPLAVLAVAPLFWSAPKPVAVFEPAVVTLKSAFVPFGRVVASGCEARERRAPFCSVAVAQA